jgi:hypothetical protein
MEVAMTDDPEEFGRKLAERRAIDTTVPAQGGAMVVLISDIYKLLVEKGLITQGDAAARLERLSNEVMASGSEPSRGLSVALIDVVRDTIANEQGRKPS